MTNSNDALRAALGGKAAVEKIAILSNQNWAIARIDMAATLDMIHEIAVAAIYPSLELCVQFSDDGQHIRKWSRIPFEGGTDFYSHPPEPAAPVEAADRVEASALRIAWWNDMRSRGVTQEDAIAKIKAATERPPEPDAWMLAQGEG